MFQMVLLRVFSIIARVPLASGFLSGKYRPGATFPASDVREAWMKQDRDAKLAEGVDGLVLKVPSDYNGSLQDVIQKIETGTISVNVQSYMALAENDLERAIGTSPNARGIVTKATAFEMQTTQLYTESEFGLHGMIKDAWLAQVVKLAQRALLAAMQNPEEGSLGEFGTEDQVALTATDAEPIDDNNLEDAAFGRQALQSTKAALAGSVAPYIDGPPKYTGGDGNVVTIRQDVLTLQDRGEQVLVTVQDLDADFGVEFVEGGRTPMSDAAMRGSAERSPRRTAVAEPTASSPRSVVV